MMRYVIHDEEGPLRTFRTRAAAIAWMRDGMRLVVLPKPPSRAVRMFARLGDALI
jgi:hypothetical protein